VIKDRKWLNMICIVIIVAVMVYLFQDVFKTNMNKYETEVAEEVTVQDTVNLDAFIVRDEQYIREATDDKTIVPLVSDGDRVASGDAVARICKQEQDAVDYAELEESKKIRDRYVRLNEQTELDALDMQKLNKDIDSAYSTISTTIMGIISPLAVFQSRLPASRYFVMTASTFCVNIEGIEDTSADSAMHTAVMGMRTGYDLISSFTTRVSTPMFIRGFLPIAAF
jgi:hypothetical protein